MDMDQSGCEDQPTSYLGKRNSDGLPNGRGTMTWLETGDRFEGHFLNGSKEGRGCFYFSDGSTLSGIYREDELQGISKYTYPDGRYMEVEHCNGEMNGQFTEYDPNGDIISIGRYKDGIRVGKIEVFDEFGGRFVGIVNQEGILSGKGIAYIYPDEKTALVGSFDHSQPTSVRAAILEYSQVENKEKMPKFTLRKDLVENVHYDVSTRDGISTQPLVPDIYERDRVYTGKSKIKGAGEGLFAKRKLDSDEIVSFYNGIRLSHDEVDSRDWSLNGNTISLDENTVLDVPDEFASTDVYCATLGHKANHSSTPNCKYDFFVHPRFGEIKCIRTLRCVEANEELTCDYGYHHKLPGTDKDDLPSWFITNKLKIESK